jgi:two-component system chemotaxis response regulator CheB
MIKVFVIDDSLLVRNSIKKVLKKDSDITIIGEAQNPVDAFGVFKSSGLPDVFILDIEMPKMDGLTFLKKISEQKPIPTIMFSSSFSSNPNNVIKAMELGAFDVIEKPSVKMEEDEKFCKMFLSKIKAAAEAHMIDETALSSYTPQTKPLKATNKIVAIGSSTGGVQTLEKILINLKPNHPPIVITQHMPPGFTKSFAQRLNNLCKNSYIKEAGDGDALLNGQVLIAPGDRHLEIRPDGKNRYRTLLSDGPKVSNHKPSVDMLFLSLAKEVRENGVAIILTGMGKDGAIGCGKVKDNGGVVYGQDEQSSIVYGMPKAAFDLGAVDRQIALDEVAKVINALGE